MWIRQERSHWNASYSRELDATSSRRHLCLPETPWGGQEERDARPRSDRIGRGLEGRGEGLLSTHLQGAELPLLKSEKVLARKAPGAFLSTEYFCRSWGHQCARLLRCSARRRPLLSYRCSEAPPRQKTVRVLLTGCGQFVVAGWVIGRSLQRFPHAFLERARRMASSSSGGMGR